jgi:cysteine desulfurase / selenocysteine lyase
MNAKDMKKLERLRRLFPVTRKSLYLNHAAVSPYSTRVAKALKGFIDARLKSDNVDLYPGIMDMIEAVRDKIARLTRAPKDTIALVKNTTEGLNILASGLPLKKRDRVILFEREFPANVYPFLNIERKGIEVDFVPERGNRFALDDVERVITARTRLLSVSHVEFLTGFRHDLAALGKLCREHGIVFCVDAIQSAGVAPIDVEAMGIDYLAAGGHKWLMGPMGTAFVYVRESLMERLEPAYAGWLGVQDSWDFFRYRIKWLPSARRFEGATQNFLGFFGLDASVGLLLEAGVPLLEEQVLSITGHLIGGLKDRGINVITPGEDTARAGIVTFSIDEPEKIFEALKVRKVFIALREGFLRVAPHFYNTIEDMELFLGHLDICRRIIAGPQ